jgi:hypothetical protein
VTWTAALLASVIAVGVAVVAPPAVARIELERGIAGVRIDDSSAHVRRVLGRPDRIVPPAWVYGAPLGGGVGFDHARRVNDVWTTSHRQRTRAGVGPGSSLRALRRAYRHARCYRRSRRGAVVLCVLRSRRGTVETDFRLAGAVKRVEVFAVPRPRRQRPLPK